jgi:hypothetical protein
MTEMIFLERVGELLTNQTLYDNAVKMSEGLSQENGLINAIVEIEK